MDLALNNLQRLICHKKTNQPTNINICSVQRDNVNNFSFYNLRSQSSFSLCFRDLRLLETLNESLVFLLFLFQIFLSITNIYINLILFFLLFIKLIKCLINSSGLTFLQQSNSVLNLGTFQNSINNFKWLCLIFSLNIFDLISHTSSYQPSSALLRRHRTQSSFFVLILDFIWIIYQCKLYKWSRASCKYICLSLILVA